MIFVIVIKVYVRFCLFLLLMELLIKVCVVLIGFFVLMISWVIEVVEFILLRWDKKLIGNLVGIYLISRLSFVVNCKEEYVC